jgi:hypothetical protein
MEVKEIQLKDLKQDKRNANKGKKAGNDKLSASVEKLGLGRGIVVDKDNFIIAGNHVQAEALKQGYTKAVIVETTGDTLVITKRTDVEIDSQIGRSLAIADNVTALESIDFDFDVLDELKLEFPDIDDDFMPNLGGADNEVNEEDLNRFFEPMGEDDGVKKMKITLEYTDEEYDIVKNALSKIAQTPEQAVWKLLDL